MPGGFLQITTYQQDGGDFTNSQPQITFFKSVFKQFTNFAIENVTVQFNRYTDPDWENPSEYISRIDNIGHLLCNIYLRVDIPQILQDDNLKLKWTNNLGIHLIDNIQLIIGGEIIQEFSSDWINIYYKRYLQYEKYQQALSQINIDNTPDKKKILNNPSILYIYLPFYFSKDWGLSIPFLNLEYQSMYFKVRIKPIKQWITIIENKKDSPYYGKRIAPYSNTIDNTVIEPYTDINIAYLTPFYIQTSSRNYNIFASKENNMVTVSSINFPFTTQVPNGVSRQYNIIIPDGVYNGSSLANMLTTLFNQAHTFMTPNPGGRMRWEINTEPPSYTQITWTINFIQNQNQFKISYVNEIGFPPPNSPFITIHFGFINTVINNNNVLKETDYIDRLKALVRGRFLISFNAHCGFLEPNEFNKLRKSNIDYLIDQNTEIIQEGISEKYVNITINQRLPIKELWILPSRDDTFSRNTYGEYSQLENFDKKDADLLKPVDYIYSEYTPTNFLRQYWFHYANEQILPTHNIIQNISLLLDKQYRFKALESPYLTLAQPLIHRYNFNTQDYIYNYSFAINPLQHQPSGFLNMDRINNAQLIIHLMNEPPPKPIFMTLQKIMNGGGVRGPLQHPINGGRLRGTTKQIINGGGLGLAVQQTFNALPIIPPSPLYKPQPNEFQPYNNKIYAYKFNIKVVIVNFNILRIKSGMCDLLIRK